MRFLLLLLPACWSLQAQVSWVSRTVAGTFPIGDGGQATAALLERPQAVAADGAGNLYIADGGNGVIRKVSTSGVITSLAGYSGFIYDLKLDTAGNLYVAGGNRAYKLTQAGVVTAVAGNGAYSFSGDGGPATSAAFNGIYALAIDANNNLYICDSNNHRVRKVTPDGIVQTIAGLSGKGFSGDGGPATNSLLNYPRHIALDSSGNIYINDYNNNRVRKIATDGMITTVAGSNICCSSPNGGLATNAYLYTGPVTTDPAGNIYIWDYFSGKIRRVTNGVIGDFAGNGTVGFAGDGGNASSARFSNVTGLGTDSQNNLYIVDADNERIRKVTPDNAISTVAGRAHFGGDGGPATSALLHRPYGVATAADGTIYFTDTVNHRVRKIGIDGKISTIAGTGDPGFAGDNGPATAALLSYPDSIAIDAAANVYVVDQSQLRVRKIAASGTITTIAGSGRLAYSNDSQGALGSGFLYIGGIAVDATGSLYLSESLNNKVKKIVLATGVMATYAGLGGAVGDFSGDGGSATAAKLNVPGALAVDSGILFIADTLNYRIRKVDPATGAITTVAGTGACCTLGDDGKATQARVNPYGLAPDGNGGLWLTDAYGVRFIAADGTIRRVAGGTTAGYAGDDSPAGGNTEYASTNGIAVTRTGDVLIADTDNSRIRKLQPNDPARMDIVSGNNQTGTTGTALQAFIVKVTGKATVPAMGVPVTFAVTAGGATLSAAATPTDVNGQAGVLATPTKAGTLTVTATSGTYSATFTATIKDPVVTPPPDVPVISAGGIGQNGFSVPPVQSISTGAITTIYGSKFLADGAPVAVNQVSGGKLSTNFSGVCVTVGGVQAPIFAVAATQVTIEVPEVTAGSVPVQVLRNCGTATEQKSNVLTATAQAATPEFLYLQANADGKNPVAAVGVAGEFIGAPGSIPGVTLRPALAGDVLVVYALGFGATSPAQTTGIPAAGIAQTAQPVTVSIGGVTLADSDVLYAGASPYFIGLYQLNLRVPAGVPSGNQPMIVKVGANQSPTGGYLAIQ